LIPYTSIVGDKDRRMISSVYRTMHARTKWT